MAHTTKPVANSWGHYIGQLRQEVADKKAKGPSTITIEVESGVVTAVRGLPDGYQYEILDHDVESEPIREALYLATVNILVRAISPGHAAEIIIFALSDYDRDDNALVDWDYAVQDGERQVPKCVSLDLGPENIAELLERTNIAELLDRMATRGE